MGSVSNYARFACAINLHMMRDVLESEDALTFSVALDLYTEISAFYLEICVGMHTMKHGVVNVHPLAIPAYERLLASVVYETAADALEALLSSRRDISTGRLLMVSEK